jgi:hypothetical protein
MDSLPAPLKTTLQLLLDTQEHEYNCEEAERVLDLYVEQRAAGQVDTSEAIRRVEEHLRVCPECFEVCEAILRVLRSGA